MKNHTEQELREIIQKAQQIAEEISNQAARLFQTEEIDGEDLHKILLANEELFRYLNSRYVKDEKLARNAVKKGFSLEDIAEITGLPLETLQKLKAEQTN